MEQNLSLLLDLSWQPLINLSLSVNFIIERNSSLLIKLRGSRLQEGRGGRNANSREHHHNYQASKPRDQLSNVSFCDFPSWISLTGEVRFPWRRTCGLLRRDGSVCSCPCWFMSWLVCYTYNKSKNVLFISHTSWMLPDHMAHGCLATGI